VNKVTEPRVLFSKSSAMHIPDGFFSVPVSIACATLSAVAVSTAALRSREHLGPRAVAMVGVTAAFIFAAQMVVIRVESDRHKVDREQSVFLAFDALDAVLQCEHSTRQSWARRCARRMEKSTTNACRRSVWSVTGRPTASAIVNGGTCPSAGSGRDCMAAPRAQAATAKASVAAKQSTTPARRVGRRDARRDCNPSTCDNDMPRLCYRLRIPGMQHVVAGANALLSSFQVDTRAPGGKGTYLPKS
jgi:hypothetical protein